MFRATSNILLTHACDGESGCHSYQEHDPEPHVHLEVMRSGREICVDLKVIEHFQIAADKQRNMAAWESLQIIQVRP
jgi:Fe2+ or Zn2+ uptake regulation protein